MKTWKKVASAALAAMVFASLTAGCGGGDKKKEAANSNEIVVGASFELTGNVANYGKSTLSGLKMAFDEVNKAGGIDGKKLRIVESDNKSEPSEAGNSVTKLVTQDKVIAVVGPATSGCVAASTPITTANKVPLIAPCATAPNITVEKGKVKEFVFRSCFIDPFQGRVMAALTKIKSTNPEAIYIPGYYEEVAKIIKQTRELGLNVPLLGCDGWDSPKLVEIGGPEALNNTYFSSAYSAQDKEPSVQKFIAGYKAMYNKEPDVFCMQGYNAGLILADAIKRAGTTDGTKLAAAIAATKDLSVASGKLTYDADHNPITSAIIIELKDGVQTFKEKITL